MKVGPFHLRRSLPLNQETAQQLMVALEQQSFAAFAENHSVTLAHLMVYDKKAQKTPLQFAMRKGLLDQVVEGLKFSKEKLTLETFTSEIPGGFGEETLLTVAAEMGHLDQVAQVLKISGEKLTLKELTAERFFGTPMECALKHRHFDQVAQIIKDSGEKLTLEMVLKKNPFDSLLDKAVDDRAVGQLLTLLNADGVRLAPEHFLARGSFNETLLEKLRSHGCLDQVFVPSNWVGHIDEMQKLSRHVPEEELQKIGYDELRNQAILLSVWGAPKITAADFQQARRLNGSAVDEQSPQTRERA